MKQLVFFLIIYSQAISSETIKEDSIKVRTTDSLFKLANKVFYNNPDSSIYYTNIAIDIAIKNNLPIQKARGIQFLAKTEVLRGDIENALEHLKDAVLVFEKYEQSNYLAKCYGLMSTALSKINNHEESIRLLLKAEQIHRKENNYKGLRSTLVNLANSYTKVKEFDKALEVLNESKKYADGNNAQWFYYYINAGIIQQNRKQYKIAKEQFDSCISISRRNKMIDAEATALTDMAKLYLVMKNYNEAISYFNNAIAMSRHNNLPLEESDALEGLIKAYETTGDYKNVYLSQNRLKVISDSLFNIEKIKNINAVEARLKVAEKEKTIALQKLDMEKSKAEQEKSDKRMQLLIVGTFLLVLILVYTFYFYTRAKRQKREVEHQKTRAEQLNSLNQKIFAVIAHDFKSPLITLNMLIDLLDKENISKEDLGAYSADVRNQITQSGQILENLLNWAKTELNLSHNSNLKSQAKKVADEIIKELNYMSSRKAISIINTIPENIELEVPADILKIICRNLVSNAVKYSYAETTVTIGLENNTTFFVKDTGSGINDKTLNNLFNGTLQSKLGTYNETGFGLGLYITQELITKFNGKIWAEKNQPSGTVFKFVLPLYEQN